MKFKDRKEARYVREVMASLLLPLINHLDVRTQNACEITLRILAETDVESEDKCIICANNGMIDDECAYCTNRNLFKAESEEQP